MGPVIIAGFPGTLSQIDKVHAFFFLSFLSSEYFPGLIPELEVDLLF